MSGDIEPLPHWAGQGVGLVTRDETAAEIVQSLVTEAEAVINTLR
jgi:NAD(P)H-dependent flavin oxidoreductase YrpB (nitropropane dioxygenase family)